MSSDDEVLAKLPKVETVSGDVMIALKLAGALDEALQEYAHQMVDCRHSVKYHYVIMVGDSDEAVISSGWGVGQHAALERITKHMMEPPDDERTDLHARS